MIHSSKRNKAKRNSSLFFRLIFVSLRFFHLIFAYFTFVFASDFWRFASKWIMWNQAFFSLPSETKFSLQFQISLPKRKWGRTLVHIHVSSMGQCRLERAGRMERCTVEVPSILERTVLALGTSNIHTPPSGYCTQCTVCPCTLVPGLWRAS